MTPFVLALLAASQPETLIVPLREVVVTGSRAPDTLLRVPAAFSVVDSRRFADGRGIHLGDALALVPGAFVQNRSGGQDLRITIRGFGARGSGERSNTGSLRGLRVLTDGMPLTEPDGRTSLDLANLGSADRVEVVRSNASAMYGNASGGVIHLRTRMDFAEPYAEARARAGSFGFHREQLATGFLLGGSRGVFTVTSSDFDGWRRHSGSSTTHGQLRLSSPLGERARLALALDAVANLNRFPGALTATEYAADPRQADPQYVQRDERRWNRVGRVGIDLQHAFAEGHDLSLLLFAEPKVLQRSERGRFRDFTRYHVGGGAIYQRGFDWGGARGRLRIGADEAWQDGSALFYTLAPDGSRGDTLRADQREGASSAGGFVEAEIRWGGGWSARAAARWDLMWYVSEDREAPALDAEKTFRRVTPLATLSRRLGDHTVYASLGGGVEAPAFNEVDPPPQFAAITSLNPILEPAHSTTWELGARGQLARLGPAGLLRYDAAAYWIEVRNDLVPQKGGSYFETAGRTRRRGVELGLDWLPLERVLLEGALTLSDNRYVDYRSFDGTAFAEYGGNRQPGLPNAAFHGSARLGPWNGATADLTVESVDGYHAEDANQVRTLPYTVLGATLAHAWPARWGVLRAFVAGDNLADEKHVASVFINGSGGRYFEPGLPRNWSAGLTARWM